MKKESRGRKPLSTPSVKVSWTIPRDLYAEMEQEAARLSEITGTVVKVPEVARKWMKAGREKLG